MKKAHDEKIMPVGPPGDIYVCNPQDHESDGGAKLMTIFWAPVK